MSYQQVGLTHPDDAFEELTTGDVVTGHRIIIDGDSDKEVVVHDSKSGASSNAPSNSGIPSAVTQNGSRSGHLYQTTDHTSMAGRIQPHEANYKP
jgi:hypothetical protein